MIVLKGNGKTKRRKKTKKNMNIKRGETVVKMKIIVVVICYNKRKNEYFVAFFPHFDSFCVPEFKKHFKKEQSKIMCTTHVAAQHKPNV